MFYREAGQFRTSYAQDSQIFPLRQDRIGIAIILIERARPDPRQLIGEVTHRLLHPLFPIVHAGIRSIDSRVGRRPASSHVLMLPDAEMCRCGASGTATARNRDRSS